MQTWTISLAPTLPPGKFSVSSRDELQAAIDSYECNTVQVQYGYSYGSGSYNCEILVANDIAVTGTLSTSNAFSGIIRSATSAKVALDGGGTTQVMSTSRSALCARIPRFVLPGAPLQAPCFRG